MIRLIFAKTGRVVELVANDIPNEPSVYDHDHITSLTATGYELELIVGEIDDIPQPSYMIQPDTEFTWCGDFAKTICANLKSIF